MTNRNFGRQPRWFYLHTRSAQHLLLEGQKQQRDRELEFTAATLDGPSASVWGDYRREIAENEKRFEQWQTIVSGLDDSTDLQESIGQVNRLAGQFESPLFRIEAGRLEALSQIQAGDTHRALRLLRDAAELAAEYGLLYLASDLWMMACESSMQIDEVIQARQCWQIAISHHLAGMRSRGADQLLPVVDTVFWEQVDRLAHPDDVLPKELTLTVSPWFERVGLSNGDELSPRVALWTAVAEFQLVTGQPHLASLSVKRAEINAPERSRPYLQIVLARTMAAQRQESLAATLLGSVAESDDPGVRAAALAALGSIKVESGAYEQGSRFLTEALELQDAERWPGRLAAEADLISVRLILGELDDALPALHAVQNEMMKSNQWQSLCRSLQNEAAMLKADGRDTESEAILQRIRRIERVD